MSGLIWMRTSDQIRGYIENTKWERLEPNLKFLLHTLILQDIEGLKAQLKVMHDEFKPDAQAKLKEIEAYRETLIERGLV